MIVELLNGLEVEGVLSGWSEVDYIEPDMAAGSWSLKAPILPNNAGLIRDWLGRDLPGIAIRNPETDYREPGFLTEYAVRDRGAEGLHLEAAGLTFKGLLEDRLAWPGSTLAELWRYNASNLLDNVDDIARALLAEDFQSPPTEAYRSPPWTVDTIPPTPAALPVETVYPRALSLATRLREILAGTGWFVQESYALSAAAVAVPSLRFEVIERPLSRVVFSTRENNIAEVAVRYRAASATHQMGVGEEIAAGPDRVVASAQGFDATWRRRYIERFTNEPSLTAAELQDELDRELADSGPATIVTATDPDPVLWGQDLRVGWRARIAVPEVDATYSYVELPVAQSTLSGRAGVWTRRLEFGSLELRDTQRLVLAIRKLQDAQQLITRGLA